MTSTATEKNLRKQMLDTLAELGGRAFRDEDIIHQGDKMILPAGMNMKDAIEFLKRKIRENEEITDFKNVYPYRPWDGAYCAYQAMREAFGSVVHAGTFFQNAQLVDVPVSHDESVKVPWGAFGIPLMPDVIITFSAAHDDEHGPVFQVVVQGPRKWRYHIEGLFRLIGEYLQKKSIYRGKALDGKEMPGFLDLEAVDREKVVYSEVTERQLHANIDALIIHDDQMRSNGISLKRAVLMHGPYGTGKTLRAFLTAQTAVENGWTFLYARPGKDNLDAVMQTARLYQPAVVFFEDVDAIANPDNAGEDGITKLLDTFDGITSKGTEIIAILTSNHADRIHKGMLRPGRLDAVVEISHLDSPGVERLVETTVPAGMLADKIDWDTVGAAMAEFTPSYIKEAADRAFRFALADTRGDTSKIKLSTQNLVDAAHSLLSQLVLMNGAKELPDRDRLSEATRAVVDEAVRAAVPELVHPDVLIVKEG